MSLIYASKLLGLTRTFTIDTADDGTITPQANDKLRCSIGRIQEFTSDFSGAKLTFTSDAPTANGSSLTKGASNTLRLDAADLSFDAGIYTIQLDYFDNADASEWKLISRQVFVLEE